MNCPLCEQPLRGRGPTMHAIWMEMESDAEIAVVVHVACAWTAIRNELYRHDEMAMEVTPSAVPPHPLDERWIGWEPMDQQSPYEEIMQIRSVRS